MDILLSWSGNASHEVALFLRDWLPEALPGCKPWVSSEDITKGRPWWDELHDFLGTAKVSVIMVTPENARSPWLFYEAGVIAGKLPDGAVVCPYLVGVAGKLIQSTPLASFQWTEGDKADTLKLIRSLSKALALPHDPGLVESAFNAKWPALKRKLEKVAETFEAIEDPVERTEPPLSQQLSNEAVVLLQSACKPDAGHNRGIVAVMRSTGGLHIQAGRYAPWEVSAHHERDPREEARWKSGVDELVSVGLLESTGSRGEMYRVTHRGWQVFDELGTPPEGDPFEPSAPPA